MELVNNLDSFLYSLDPRGSGSDLWNLSRYFAVFSPVGNGKAVVMSSHENYPTNKLFIIFYITSISYLYNINFILTIKILQNISRYLPYRGRYHKNGTFVPKYCILTKKAKLQRLNFCKSVFHVRSKQNMCRIDLSRVRNNASTKKNWIFFISHLRGSIQGLWTSNPRLEQSPRRLFEMSAEEFLKCSSKWQKVKQVEVVWRLSRCSTGFEFGTYQPVYPQPAGICQFLVGKPAVLARQLQ